MKMLSESSCALLLLTLIRFLQLLPCNVALALLNTMRNYCNVIKVDLPTFVHYVCVAFTFVNLVVQQSKTVFIECYSYDRRFAWAALGAAILHLLGAGSSYIVSKNKVDMYSCCFASMLLVLATFSISFEKDNSMQAFLLCQFVLFVLRLRELIPRYYLLVDGLTVPLSLASTGDARIKFKVSEEESRILELDPSSWFEVREDYADMFKFKPNVRHEVVLSVFSIKDNIFEFTLKNYRAKVVKKESQTSSSISQFRSRITHCRLYSIFCSILVKYNSCTKKLDASTCHVSLN
ncbi:uncharacterized protein LOC141693025 [Apium graveolens]|uniref:uncharacterized protein LOC141693025 n=1 Tax=Apium graveolens TaxID=4045 RepID=UPI003D794B53